LFLKFKQAYPDYRWMDCSTARELKSIFGVIYDGETSAIQEINR
jgi:hypothetical protein